ncbi:MAG: ribonuclease III domain-containing protein [Lachnospiraceae bacterium]|nr:ribonuclease III domain-containing protein [Lachnospiraceae bacterium]MDD3796490.1 ribonuclease III domain-containing protein [Lachnospiraceae bacterium]
MEEGVNQAMTYLAETFGLEEKDWRMYSPLTLAYIGDAAYDLLIRTILVRRANCQTAKLHQRACALVKAGTQAEMAAVLLPHLTEEEAGVYRRGHNSKPYNTAKNASRREYLEATGFEALMGYLYLKQDFQRMTDLVKMGLEESGHEI